MPGPGPREGASPTAGYTAAEKISAMLPTVIAEARSADVRRLNPAVMRLEMAPTIIAAAIGAARRGSGCAAGRRSTSPLRSSPCNRAETLAALVRLTCAMSRLMPEAYDASSTGNP
jgi:hypothetical protein